jgi:hypothetical protein
MEAGFGVRTVFGPCIRDDAASWETRVVEFCFEPIDLCLGNVDFEGFDERFGHDEDQDNDEGAGCVLDSLKSMQRLFMRHDRIFSVSR